MYLDKNVRKNPVNYSYPLFTALQSVFSNIGLPQLVGNVSSSAAQQLISHVITTASQDQSSPLVQDGQTLQQFVQQPGITIVPSSHPLVNCASSTAPTTQLVVATATHDQPAGQILQDSTHLTQYGQQAAVPLIQNLIDCENQERL